MFASAGQLPSPDALTCHNTYGAVLWYSFKTSCTPARASRGPAIRASRTWLTTHNFHIVSYWQLDNWYLGATTVPPGGYPDPDGVAAYSELVAAATP